MTRATVRFHDLGPDFHTTQVNINRKIYNLVHQREGFGHTVALTPAG